MSRKAKRGHSKKKAYSLLKIISAVLVLSCLTVAVSIGIKSLSDFLTSEKTDFSSTKELNPQNNTPNNVSTSAKNADEDVTFVIAVMADSENDFESLERALEKSTQLSVDYILFLGDYTNWGDVESLVQANILMKEAGIPYLSIPGDHDLAASVQGGDLSGLANFTQVLGDNFHSLSLGDTKIVLLDNSANYTKIPEDLVNWFNSQIGDAKFVFLSQPLYHPTFKIVMGIVDGEVIPLVNDQAQSLLKTIRESDVRAVISADQHLFSRNEDPADSGLEHIVVGALTSERNPQTPRFCLLYLLQNGDYRVEEIVL